MILTLTDAIAVCGAIAERGFNFARQDLFLSLGTGTSP